MARAEVYRFRRVLDRLAEAPRWPPGFSIIPFDPPHHARLVHRLLADGYANGGGRVPDFDDWWRALATDAEYEPGLIFLVGDPDGTPVAVAICWSSTYVKDLVVAAAARRRGLAANMLRHIFHIFRARGAGAVDLKVDAENSGAICLYRSVGMTCIETLHVER